MENVSNPETFNLDAYRAFLENLQRSKQNKERISKQVPKINKQQSV